MKKVFLIVILGAGVLFSIAACKSSKVKIPSDIIPEQKMQQIMIDVLIGEAYADQHPVPQDSNRNIRSRLYNEIFLKYNINKSDYSKSYSFYAHHPALFEKEMLPVIDSLNAMDARIPGGNPPAPPMPTNNSKPSIISNMNLSKRFVPAK